MTQGFFEQLLIILCSAIIATTLFRRINLPPILAYLSVGAIIGPYSIGVIEDVHSIELLSELGVVFLLFMLGLEFSLSRMLAMRKAVFGLGSLQVILTAATLGGVCLLLGQPWPTAVVIAGALSLSSTAIVSRELIQRNELDTAHGQLSVGTLIFQDLAAVFFLILVPALGQSRLDLDISNISLLFLEGAGLLIVLLLVGRFIMPALFHESARSGASDVFVLTTLCAALLAAWLTHAAGLSMALGGFIAGMMFGESRYRYQLEADIRPFRDLLLGLFFVSVGMQLDLQALLQNWYWVLLFTAGLIILKTLLITALGSLLHRDPANALRAGLSLSQGGEFGFALLALALGNQLIASDVNAIAVTTIISSMIITPMLMNHTGRISRWCFPQAQALRQQNLKQAQEIATVPLNDHVIICGFGRVGQIIARFLTPLEIPYIAVDNDPVRVLEASTAGENVCFGDACREDILSALDAQRARMVILCFPDAKIAMKALKHLRSRFPDLPVLVRTADDSSLAGFQAAGATEIIPEALEGSLTLVSHVLSLLQIPDQEINQQINQVRAERYSLLHGFYHGQHNKKHAPEALVNEVLHPVPINAQAYACERSIAELNLEKLQLRVAMIRRCDTALQAPDAATQLAADDIIVLAGPSEMLELGESLLISGR